jgi:hypothetical protein
MPTEAEQYHTMTAYLSRLYDAPLFERAGVQHPVVLYPAHAEQMGDVDSILGRVPVDRTRADDFAIYNHALLQTLRNSGRNVFNGTTFALKLLKQRRGKLTLEATLGSYFDMLATCIALEQELRDAAATSKRGLRLPTRTQLHRSVDPADALTRGVGRSAAIGGNTLIVFAHEVGYKAMLMRRTAQAAIDAGRYHVMPAFIFQPKSSAVQPYEWSLRYHIEREYLEELFGMPETGAADFSAHPALLDLRAMLADGRALLHLTGVAVNLLTLRPEICFLLLIHDPDWYRRITAPDSTTPLNADSEAAEVVLVPIASDHDLLNALPPDVHTRMPAHALAALWAGVDQARQHLY